jgi:aryl-alcohol dehydrogenase-like predicted oxidoreductase
MRAAHPRVVLGLHRSRHERHLLKAALDLGVEAIDTSTNYLGFRSHQTLAKVAGDLLPKFHVSTKVGYFPAGGMAEHSLDPARLRQAVEEAVRTLGREPNLVLLHNPEQTLAGLSVEAAQHRLGDACAVLAKAAASGLCGAWGISTWDPRPMAVDSESLLSPPHVLMVRAGLLVGLGTLAATETLVQRWKPTATWGMSPFGGSASDPVWEKIDPRLFLSEPHAATRPQAAFRAAFHLPDVDAVAVGTDNPNHLRQLTASLTTEVDQSAISQYRRLLQAHRQTRNL